MCTNPITQDGVTFACRCCDECIATRRSGWIARAMAEKSGHGHTVCIALTYSEATQESRDGARMFSYHDVRLFMARIRDAARQLAKKERWNIVPTIRFLCAGEQGDRFGRCHWHMILYSNFDVTRLGKFMRRRKQVRCWSDMVTVGKRKRRLNWSMWPHGFITLQEPDQGGMAYVLSYCLKDQFTHEKARGTMREAGAENFATGLFRMSKRPAIGEAWLYSKLESLLQAGAVLPNTQLKIPDMSGYWHPNGSFREKLLWGLVAVNRQILWATGANAPQWPALRAACRDNPSDMEILNGKEVQDPDDAESDEAIFERRSRETADRYRRAEFAGRCGSALPCTDCLHELTDAQLAVLGVRRLWPEDGSEWQYEAVAGFDAVRQRQKQRADGINPYCQQRGSKFARLVFPASAPSGAN